MKLRLGRDPIIIGGCGRSGTSLLLSILSCHPHIFTFPNETYFFCPMVYDKNVDFNSPFRIQDFCRLLFSFKIPWSCRRWCEKTPQNVIFFGRILKYFGKKVKIINIVRDGRDVITSRHPSDLSKFWVSSQRWINDVEAGLSYENHPQVLTIRYEDLINNYETTVKSICAFIGEDFRKEFLQFPKTAKEKLTEFKALNNEVQSIFADSIGRWKDPKYALRVEELMNNPRAKKILAHYHYL
ncbi:MAG: sulfotransferase [Candidatus Omnitrophica bacterium]|nr:sulfotransferase [Candidatus Omnitrophota bacterium]